MANNRDRVLVGEVVATFTSPVGGAAVAYGYTEDGVIFEYAADTVDIEVEEETMPIERVITKETVAIIINLAESSLANIAQAMAGAALAGATITIGAGAIKGLAVVLVGTTPTGGTRTITVPLATAAGTVGMSYTKGAKTVVPLRVEALKGAGAGATIVDT